MAVNHRKQLHLPVSTPWIIDLDNIAKGVIQGARGHSHRPSVHVSYSEEFLPACGGLKSYVVLVWMPSKHEPPMILVTLLGMSYLRDV